MCWIVVSFIFHPEVTYFRSLSLILFIICLLIFTSDWLLWLSCPICRISNAYFISILFSQWIAGKSSCKHFESRNQICVCVCMLYGKDTKYLKMITQKKSVSSVVSQNMNSIKTVLVGEMLLLAVCVNSGFRKWRRWLRKGTGYKFFSSVPSPVPASVRMSLGREESLCKELILYLWEREGQEVWTPEQARHAQLCSLAWDSSLD